MQKGEKIIVRNPNSTRPYQHVLEPLFSYMDIAQKQYEDSRYEGNYNIGPDDCDCITTGELAELFCQKWGGSASWSALQQNGPHEANFLKLDCARMKRIFKWSPTWHVEEAIEKTVEWSRAYFQNKNMDEIMNEQIKCFMMNRMKTKERESV